MKFARIPGYSRLILEVVALLGGVLTVGVRQLVQAKPCRRRPKLTSSGGLSAECELFERMDEREIYRR